LNKFIFFIIFLNSCGYGFSSLKNPWVEENVNTVSVNIFKNKTFENDIEIRRKELTEVNKGLLDSAEKLAIKNKKIQASDLVEVLSIDHTTACRLVDYLLNMGVIEFTQNSKADDAYSFKYKWNNGWSEEIIPIKPIFELKLPVNENDKFKFENTSDADVFVTVTTSGISALGEIMAEQKNLNLAVVYKDMDGREIDITNLKHGVDFYAQILVTNPGKYGDIENLALNQLFPSGWEIINTRVFDIGAELKSDDADYIDYKDDGVNFFFGLTRGAKKKFIVLLNAAYRGKYFLPATQCGDMYNNNVKAVTGGGWVLVN
jgi:uncharacterized protein YfaS (alpha-2-macroglobulin family)